MSKICELCGAEFKSFVKPMCGINLNHEKEFFKSFWLDPERFHDNDLDDLKCVMSYIKESIAKIVVKDVLHHELPDTIRKEKCTLPYDKIKFYQQQYKELEKKYWIIKKIYDS